MSIYFGFSSWFFLREILSIFQISLWLMPVSRKHTSYRSGGKSSRLTDRNGHASIGRQTTKAAPSLLRQTSAGVPLLTVSPVYHKPAAVTPVFTSAQFEALYLAFHVTGLFFHCINIYKSNLHLVDTYLLLFIVMILLQRVLWLTTKQTLASEVIHTTKYWVTVSCKASVVVLLFIVTVAAMYLTISNSSFEDILFLCYPLGIYVWAFGLTLNPHSQKILLRINTHVTIHQTTTDRDCITDPSCVLCSIHSSNDCETSPLSAPTGNGTSSSVCTCQPLSRSKDQLQEKTDNCRNNNMSLQTHRSPTQNSISADSVLKRKHCTVTPDNIRHEAESWRIDFNLRLTQVVFNSLLSAYYIGFVPMKFTQNGWLHYDVWWSLQFTFYIWTTSFVLLFFHLIPYHYIDGLHRCALHLGQWATYVGRREPSETWSGVTTWPHATLVRHQHVIYKSVARQTSATPGDVHQYRFYFLFHCPLRLHNIMVLVQASSAVCQLMSLYRASNSQQLIAMAILLGFNYFLLFRLLRERWAISETMDEHESCANSGP